MNLIFLYTNLELWKLNTLNLRSKVSVLESLKAILASWERTEFCQLANKFKYSILPQKCELLVIGKYLRPVFNVPESWHMHITESQWSQYI